MKGMEAVPPEWSYCEFLLVAETWGSSSFWKHVFITLISLIKIIRLSPTLVGIELKM